MCPCLHTLISQARSRTVVSKCTRLLDKLSWYPGRFLPLHMNTFCAPGATRTPSPDDAEVCQHRDTISLHRSKRSMQSISPFRSCDANTTAQGLPRDSHNPRSSTVELQRMPCPSHTVRLTTSQNIVDLRGDCCHCASILAEDERGALTKGRYVKPEVYLQRQCRGVR